MSEEDGLPGRPYEEFATFNLTSEERRERIIQVLREQDEVSVAELSQRLGVSEVTTRKDLQQLEEQGYLTRVRGGAVVSGRGQLELRFAARQQVNLDEKRRIASRAVHLIQPGATVFLDGSTTAFQMTRLLRDMQNLTVITTGLYAALELSFAPDVTTIVAGGILRRRTSSLVDTLSPKLLRRLHVDIAFLSCRGFTAESGMMESDLREAQTKRAMAETAARKIALVDNAKFGDIFVATSLLPEEIDLLIVDSSLPDSLRKSLEAAQIPTEYV
ncbi:MAG: DeoR/GlpR family DNA-binding transcription regulator [Caldilinea sp.]|uniref:DeoR/GlpR family DNA-binding transcription regulator n=1 Tax=Caldilinea sp. TaxID=2293560 RepID=UPI002CD5920E|nr:DeoR/GlpR transcriptional regulator [Anaerolineales bacterium]HQY90154.1 DeoR/GlpR family DNA-binding transcription regulator [Caldilinea sp.]HRA67595.1 DeoR/GlpR family DNA-binding transcription regulator [Caldilinea sp.]